MASRSLPRLLRARAAGARRASPRPPARASRPPRPPAAQVARPPRAAFREHVEKPNRYGARARNAPKAARPTLRAQRGSSLLPVAGGAAERHWQTRLRGLSCRRRCCCCCCAPPLPPLARAGFPRLRPAATVGAAAQGQLCPCTGTGPPTGRWGNTSALPPLLPPCKSLAARLLCVRAVRAQKNTLRGVCGRRVLVGPSR